MPSGRKVTPRRPGTFSIARVTTVLWVIAVLLSPLFTGGFRTDGDGARLSFNYGLVALSALVPAAGWTLAVARLVTQNRVAKILDPLMGLSADAFRDWTATRFQALGYATRQPESADGRPVDLVVERGGETGVVRCRNYTAWTIGEPTLRDLVAAMRDYGAQRAYLVTTSYLTSSARKWVAGQPITVWDGDHLARLTMRETPPNRAAAQSA